MFCRPLLDHLGTKTTFGTAGSDVAVLLVVFLFVQCTRFLSQPCKLSLVTGIYWCYGVVWPSSWVGLWVIITENFLEELRNTKHVIVRSFTACKSDVLSLSRAEQKSEDCHNKSKAANL